MKTYLDCIPCFFRQMLDGARIIKASPENQKWILDEFAKMIPGISLKSCPPEIARLGYGLLKNISPDGDPYKDIKQKSNKMALRLLEKLNAKVARSKDKLLTALELAIAGNIIDFGVKNNLDVKTELTKILKEENRSIHQRLIFHYPEFKRVLKKSKNILYLGDNAGEVVFDRILIEEIKRIHPDKTVYYAVKDRPIINDALIEDAKFCSIDKTACVISNGTDAPGTVLDLCSDEFIKIYNNSDMIISKGQGNFESLSEKVRPIFFLFMVKCPVVAEETNCAMGDIVLLYNQKKNLKNRRKK
jgi:damage-control phosphatase, subfamily I